MTDVSERRISHTELHLIAFRCAKCGVELAVDLANDTQRRAVLASTEPLTCTVCGQTFDRYLRESLRLFSEMRAKLADAQCEVVFRVPETPKT